MIVTKILNQREKYEKWIKLNWFGESEPNQASLLG
jgi:hypothetical protein